MYGAIPYAYTPIILLLLAYRGFGHIELAFVIERAMDILADKLNMDSMELRMKNAIAKEIQLQPESVMDSNTGDLEACIKRNCRNDRME